MTITITTIPTHESALVVPGEPTVETSAELLLNAITDAGLDDPRWVSAGVLVTEAAEWLRQALGTQAQGSCASVPPVVREADFTMAARPLLGGAVVVDVEAARHFVRSALEAALALGSEARRPLAGKGA